jgi:hypothetical protein
MNDAIVQISVGEFFIKLTPMRLVGIIESSYEFEWISAWSAARVCCTTQILYLLTSINRGVNENYSINTPLQRGELDKDEKFI